MISAIVLTKNEENNIRECLESLSWCDEIIVIDDDSVDNTAAIAKEFHAQVYSNTLKDFATQRNFGLEKARHEWVLFVDADERVSDTLRHEIEEKISHDSGSISGYFAKREDRIWGRTLMYGETAHIRLLRLAKKDAGKWIGKVHETWQISGKTAILTHPIIHYPHPTIADFLADVNTYSTIRAHELYKKNIRTNMISIIAYPKGKFILNYIFKRGFLDGVPGLLVATMMSLHSFLVRGKLWLLWKKNHIR